MRKLNTRRSILLALFLLVACALLAGVFFQSSNAQKSRRAEVAAQPRTQTAHTRLVLLIVVDQFRYDYLERFGDLFAANGIRRLLREGASWSEANYDHAPTFTSSNCNAW